MADVKSRAAWLYARHAVSARFRLVIVTHTNSLTSQLKWMSSMADEQTLELLGPMHATLCLPAQGDSNTYY